MVLTEFLIHFQACFMKGKTYWSCCYGHLILMEKFIVKWKIGKIALTLINSLSMHFICFNWCLLYHHNCICTLFSLEKTLPLTPTIKTTVLVRENSTPRSERYHDLATGALQSISPTYTQILAHYKMKTALGGRE